MRSTYSAASAGSCTSKSSPVSRSSPPAATERRVAHRSRAGDALAAVATMRLSLAPGVTACGITIRPPHSALSATPVIAPVRSVGDALYIGRRSASTPERGAASLARIPAATMAARCPSCATPMTRVRPRHDLLEQLQPLGVAHRSIHPGEAGDAAARPRAKLATNPAADRIAGLHRKDHRHIAQVRSCQSTSRARLREHAQMTSGGERQQLVAIAGLICSWPLRTTQRHVGAHVARRRPS